MRIRFQADADFNNIIVAAAVRRFPEIDFRGAVLAGLAGLTDAEVLALAAKDGRVLVTHDQTTMLAHFGMFSSDRRRAPASSWCRRAWRHAKSSTSSR